MAKASIPLPVPSDLSTAGSRQNDAGDAEVLAALEWFAPLIFDQGNDTVSLCQYGLEGNLEKIPEFF